MTKAAKTEIKRTYWENGNIRTEERYVDGIKNGLSKTYLIDGRLLTAKNYKDGLLHGKCKDYSSIDGELLLETSYKSGEVSSITHYTDGRIFDKIYYQCGTVSKHVMFDKEGKAIKTEHFIMGLADGDA